MELIPQDDRLVVEARVDPSDVDVVHSGLPAQVKLTAFNQRYAPALDGRVKWVSADRLTDQRTGQPYRSEEHTSELQSLMRTSYAVFCLKQKHKQITQQR